MFIVGIVIDKNMHKYQLNDNYSQENLPIYSIMLPAYKEANIIPRLITNIENLEYPKDKLQLILILEEDDLETISITEHIQKSTDLKLDILVKPNSYPKTKANACNYALDYIKGEYVAIFDADDKPDPDQLLKALEIFKKSSAGLACIQAKLSYYNAMENILTRLFTIEYSILFDYTLLSLQKFNLFIPLGGSSNHFKTDILKKIKWDPYNLTEDADIGVRLKLRGYKVHILDSYTMEESPIDLKSWIKQRSRWSKGFIQTYLVHSRNLSQIFSKFKLIGFLLFHNIFCIGMISALGAIPFTIINAIIGDITIKIITYSNFLLFYTTSFLQGYIVNKLRFEKSLNIKELFLFPFYILLQIIPIIRSFFQLFINQHHWEKTKHGLTSYSEPTKDK